MNGGGIPKHFHNMDTVRYALCSCVLLSHLFYLNGLPSIFPIETFNVGFFALSGFLAYATFCKAPSAGSYLRRRFFRIMTPYYIVVVGFALFLAPLSSLGVPGYFASGGFWAYMAANVTTLNFLCPTLPGVFEGSEFVTPVVNASLWTMKVELVLFLTFPLFMCVQRRYPQHTRRLLLAIIAVSYIFRICMTLAYQHTGNRMYDIMGRQFFGEFCFYYMGVYFYLYIKEILRNRYVILAAIVLIAVVKYCLWNFPTSSALLITSLSLWISVALPFTIVEIKTNISYMIYLCHCPLLQLGIGLHLKEMMPAGAYYAGAVLVIVFVSWWIKRFNEKVVKLERLQNLYR